MTRKWGMNCTFLNFTMKTAKLGILIVTIIGTAIMIPCFAGSLNAADRDYVLIGRPETSTGPISGFGEPSPWADNRVLDYINKQGGVFIEEYGKKVPVKMKLMDNESSGTKAGEIASRLILHDKVDIMVFYQFSEAIASICERYEMPNLVVEHPLEPWQAGGPYKWSYQSGISFKSAIAAWTAIWEEKIDRTNKTFGVLAPNDADGIAMAKNFTKMLEDKAWKVVDVGRYPSGLQDWTSVVKRMKDGKVQILTGSMASPDFAAAWRQINQQEAVPKICSVGRATLFPSGVNAIGGDLANGLVVDIHWNPQYPFKSSLTGETCQQVADAWDKETKKQWTQVLGFKYAGMELAIDILKRAKSIDKNKILKAIEETNLETLIGRIKYNKDHYCLTPIVTGQWIKGKTWPWEPVIVNNKHFPVIPITADMIFPLPGYRE